MKEQIDEIVDKIVLGCLSQTEATEDLLKLFDDNNRTFTKEDLKKAYNNGSRQGSVNEMRVARGGEMNVKPFDKWYSKNY